MVNEAQGSARAAERALALSYAPAERRAALTTLFELDARLRTMTRVAREPMIGLMRLTWWGEALERLDRAPPPAEPLLRSLAAEVLPHGVSGAALAALVDAWEPILEPPVDWRGVAERRGAGLFGLAAALLGGDPADAVGGGYWAGVDLARDWPAALTGVGPMPPLRLARALRPLGALVLAARYDAGGRIEPGDPRRVGRLFWHRLMGR